MTDLLDPKESKLNEAERKKHLVTIEMLAQQSGAPMAEVVKLYREELERVMPSTRIRDFLPILVARKVRQDLKNH